MKLLATCCLLLTSLLTITAHATVVIEGNIISWPDDGWYQVQDATNYSTVCEGGRSCEVPNGVYNVINLTTQRRFENLRVGEVTDSSNFSTASDVLVHGNEISWLDNGWYQVQRASDYVSVCEGGRSCIVEPGIYVVINLTTNTRYEGVIVGNIESAEEDNRPVINTDNYHALVTQVWEVISGQAFDYRMIELPYFRNTENNEEFSLCANGGSHWQRTEMERYLRLRYSMDTDNCLFEFNRNNFGDVINGYHYDLIVDDERVFASSTDRAREIGFQEFTAELSHGGRMEINGGLSTINIPHSDWGRDTYIHIRDLDYFFTYAGGTLRVENAVSLLRRYFVTSARGEGVVGYMHADFSMQANSTQQNPVIISTPRRFEYTADHIIEQGGDPSVYGSYDARERYIFARGILRIESPSDSSSLELNADTGDYRTVSITISNSEGSSEQTVEWAEWVEALVGVIGTNPEDRLAVE